MEHPRDRFSWVRPHPVEPIGRQSDSEGDAGEVDRGLGRGEERDVVRKRHGRENQARRIKVEAVADPGPERSHVEARRKVSS